ncbi:MAG: META domain-containing protein [Vicingaceae bacterium]|jgi:heat shock protein HslJ
MKTAIATIFAILLLTPSCKNKKEVTEKETKKVESVTQTTAKSMTPFGKDLGGELVGKYWKAIELMGEPVEMTEEMKKEPYLTFKRDGTITAYGGCNTIFGDYKLGVKNFVEMNNFSQTEMECNFKSYEEKMTEALIYGKQYIFTGEDQMQIIIGKRAPLGIFKAVYF